MRTEKFDYRLSSRILASLCVIALPHSPYAQCSPLEGKESQETFPILNFSLLRFRASGKEKESYARYRRLSRLSAAYVVMSLRQKKNNLELSLLNNMNIS